ESLILRGVSLPPGLQWAGAQVLRALHASGLAGLAARALASQETALAENVFAQSARRSDPTTAVVLADAAGNRDRRARGTGAVEAAGAGMGAGRGGIRGINTDAGASVGPASRMDAGVRAGSGAGAGRGARTYAAAGRGWG